MLCFCFELFIYSSQLIRFTRTRRHQPKPKLLNARPKLVFISQFENFSFFQENVKNLKCKWFVEKIQCVIVKCLVRKDKINAISEANQFLVRFFSWKRKISLQNLKHCFCFLAFFLWIYCDFFSRLKIFVKLHDLTIFSWSQNYIYTAAHFFVKSTFLLILLKCWFHGKLSVIVFIVLFQIVFLTVKQCTFKSNK